MKLSANFQLSELTFSQTAEQLGIHNEPNPEQIEKLQKLVVHVLQPLRDYFLRPVHISSGFRSAPLNRAIGGALTSQHMRGEAADIKIAGIGNDLIWQYIRDNLEFDQVILERCRADNPYSGWVHVSYREGNNRGEDLSYTPATGYVEGLVYVS